MIVLVGIQIEFIVACVVFCKGGNALLAGNPTRTINPQGRGGRINQGFFCVCKSHRGGGHSIIKFVSCLATAGAVVFIAKKVYVVYCDTT